MTNKNDFNYEAQTTYLSGILKDYRMFSLLAIVFSLVLTSFTINTNSNVHGFKITSIDGEEISLSKYKGKVLVLVNVASNGPLAEQYKSLQKLHTEFKDQVVVIGFPSNSYNNELETDKEIRSHCRSKYKVSFPLSTKIEVKGGSCHPLFNYLAKKSLNGEMDAPANFDFHKYIIDGNGKLVKMLEPNKDIYDGDAIATIKSLLGA